ncbi:hypothetical protein BgiBS90_023418, partial [Biomphalaria glabrata]
GMDDYSQLAAMAEKYKLPLKERSTWIEKQMTLKVRNEELKLRNKELENASKMKTKDTNEEQSL